MSIIGAIASFLLHAHVTCPVKDMMLYAPAICSSFLTILVKSSVSWLPFYLFCLIYQLLSLLCLHLSF